MTRLVGIDWAPVNIPFERRMQTLAVLHYVFVFIISPWFCVFGPLYILFYTTYWWLVVLYGVWYMYDIDTSRRGSRPSEFMRTSGIWRYFANYFPMKLVKTAELSPEKNYIIGSHPHGILSMGAFTTFCTEATKFSKKFPGLTPSLLTLNGQFMFPIRREFAMFIGAVESSRESLKWLLKNPGKGRAVGIVLGGAAEALDAHPNNYDLLMSRIKGFIRFAIKYGADLVPMYNFGENECYRQYSNPKGSKVRAWQNYLQKILGFAPPIIFGRGVFNYSFGWLPFRTPITTVVGAPICVEQVTDPTDEQIDNVHKEYCDQLTKLFDEHKTDYGVPKDAKLNIY